MTTNIMKQDETLLFGKHCKVIHIDPGNTVLCDFCNDDFTDSDETGGCLVGSYGVCPKCTKGITHINDISRYCPLDVKFKDFIYDIRKHG